MQKKKAFGLVLSFALVACLAVAGTLAYLTYKTETVTNTFTVGNITATLDESVVDEYGVAQDGRTADPQTYKLMPGHKYTKDPIVHVAAGSEKCWVFVKVVDGLANAQAPVTIVDQMSALGWEATGTENVWVYETPVEATADKGVDLTVFENLTILNTLTAAQLENFADKTITVTACAVQHDGLDSVDKALASAVF